MFWQHSCYLEHFTSAFTITGCDNWSVNVKETTLLEEFMCCVSKIISDSSHCGDEFCAWAQVSNISQVFNSVIFLCEWVCVSGAITNNLNSVGICLTDLQLNRLTFGGWFNQLTFNFKTCSNSCVGNLCEVWHRTINNNLKSCSTTSVSEFNEAKIFTTHTCGACPTCNLNNVVKHLFVLGCCECCNSNSLSKWEGCNSLVFNSVVSN